MSFRGGNPLLFSSFYLLLAKSLERVCMLCCVSSTPPISFVDASKKNCITENLKE